jgi:hypothetical protein
MTKRPTVTWDAKGKSIWEASVSWLVTMANAVNTRVYGKELSTLGMHCQRLNRKSNREIVRLENVHDSGDRRVYRTALNSKCAFRHVVCPQQFSDDERRKDDIHWVGDGYLRLSVENCVGTSHLRCSFRNMSAQSLRKCSDQE